jgi:hypothetical protein
MENKKRVHFHSFMLDVHSKIHEVKKGVVRDHGNTKLQPFDPIPPVASSITENIWLLCFDEFQVILFIYFQEYSFYYFYYQKFIICFIFVNTCI